MKNFKQIIAVVILLLSVTQVSLHAALWRGELKVQDGKQAPFLFELNKSADGKSVVTLLNGKERVDFSGVKFTGDSVFIPIDSYDAVIKAVVKGNEMNGLFIKNYIENDPGVPFHADQNSKNRFAVAAQSVSIQADGKWDVYFADDKGGSEHNVGIFKSEKGIITGSVLTNSGDLRFLEGNYTADGFQLSAFSGLSPYLFEFRFTDANHFEGTFFTSRGKTKVTGVRNDKAGLDDPYSLTKLKPGSHSLSFSLPNTDGQKISLQDARYRNKVVVVSILGSWCPNCLDEMKFLAPWYAANKDRGVEIIGLAFERKDDFEYAKGTLGRLKTNYHPGYELLFGGKVGPEATSKALPEIDKVSSYPTLIFIDKKGQVRKIHTGFNGPATGLFYDEFQKEFNELINQLLSE